MKDSVITSSLRFLIHEADGSREVRTERNTLKYVTCVFSDSITCLNSLCNINKLTAVLIF